jgi:hypothetical protein
MTSKIEIENQMAAAIDRSISQREIVHITVNGDSEDVLAVIARYVGDDTDYTMIDCATLDVWGWTDKTPENETNWRLAIRLTGTGVAK